jgi:hypothetical protein
LHRTALLRTWLGGAILAVFLSASFSLPAQGDPEGGCDGSYRDFHNTNAKIAAASVAATLRIALGRQ